MSNSCKEPKTVLPGSTIGILGGGQLGRMMALSARAMGYRVITLDPTPDSPCGQVSDEQIVAEFTDLNAALDLAHKSDVVTYEFENVDAKVANALEETAYVPQGSEILRITQHRVLEKQMLQSAGVPTAAFVCINSAEDLEAGVERLGFPCVLKTTRGGYDGKGQWLLRRQNDVQTAKRECEALFTGAGITQFGDAPTLRHEDLECSTPLILESFVSFDKEVSVVVARNPRGEIRTFPVSENIHVHHILHESIVPARISRQTADAAVEMARRIADTLDMVGLLAVEMFVTSSGSIYVNELAPRTHNSGHYTMDACVTSQFEQHIRAVCNLPLGAVDLLCPVVMVNVLGEHLAHVTEQIHRLPSNFKVHLYGKRGVKAGRKMGHINVVSESVEHALGQIDDLGIWRG